MNRFDDRESTGGPGSGRMMDDAPDDSGMRQGGRGTSMVRRGGIGGGMGGMGGDQLIQMILKLLMGGGMGKPGMGSQGGLDLGKLFGGMGGGGRNFMGGGDGRAGPDMDRNYPMGGQADSAMAGGHGPMPDTGWGALQDVRGSPGLDPNGQLGGSGPPPPDLAMNGQQRAGTPLSSLASLGGPRMMRRQ